MADNSKDSKDYTDSNGEEMKKGFYRFKDSDLLFYFTGEYDKEGFPVFDENSTKQRELYRYITGKLNPLSKEEIQKMITEARERANLLEKGLKE